MLLGVRLVHVAPRPQYAQDAVQVGCGALAAAAALLLVLRLFAVVVVRALLCATPFAMAALVRRARVLQKAERAGASNAGNTGLAQTSQLKSYLTVMTLCFLGQGLYMGVIGFANDALSGDEYISRQFATCIFGCGIACLVLWFAARASVEGPYIICPIMLGTSALVLVLTIMSAAAGGDSGGGDQLAHVVGRATNSLLFVMAVCTMVTLARAERPQRIYQPAAVPLLCACALLAGIAAGGVMMSVVGLTVLSTAIVAASLLYGALLSLGLSVQQRDRGSYVIVRNSQDMARIADAQARALGDELGTLTPREAEVLPYLLQHQSIEAIAHKMGISGNTVKSHVAHIYEKAGVNARQQLIDLAAAKTVNL